MARETEPEGTVTGDDAATPPASVREAVGPDPGDTPRRRVTEGELPVAVVTQREGAFGGLDPAGSGESPHAAEDRDRVAGGRWRRDGRANRVAPTARSCPGRAGIGPPQAQCPQTRSVARWRSPNASTPSPSTPRSAKSSYSVECM